MKNIYLKKGKEESLLRFHPWVFSGAIQSLDEGIHEGDIVRVLSGNRQYIATGHFQQGSIAVRVLTFADVPIDDCFWESRLQSALDMRIAIGLADREKNNAYRLVHGEGDNLPGLIIDIYGETAVMQAHSIGMHVYRHEVAEALVKVMARRIKHVYYKVEAAFLLCF
jgi:23S rRNA (cytosine1962-C5)-methyltransferase